MATSIWSFIVRIHTWIILAIIILFSVASLYSCLNLIRSEQQDVKSLLHYQSQLAKSSHSFERLEEYVYDYFGSEKTQDKLNNISNEFATLQSLLIDDSNQRNIMAKSSVHIGDIQRQIAKIVPHINYAREYPDSGLPREVRVYLSAIEHALNHYKDAALETSYFELSAKMQVNRRSILISLSLLGGAIICLLLFLLYKNQALEQAIADNRQITDTAQQRMAAIEAAEDGIGIMDAEMNLIYMNKALCELHSIPEEDKETYIGHDWTKLYNEVGQEHVRRHVYPLLEALGEWMGESPVQKKNGDIIQAELSLTKLPDGKGMIGTARDITERRLAEKEKQQLQDQVHQAQKMEAIGRLAGGIAHDFNNILAAIMGYAEFLSEDLSKDKELKTYADNILMAGKKARALIDQMLAFSRRKDSKKEMTNLHQIIDETIMMVRASLPKTIELKYDNHYDATPYVNGDGGLVTQAVMNILVNAIDAMETEHGAINIAFSIIEPDDDMFEGMMAQTLPPVSEMPPVTISELEPGHTMLEMGRMKREETYFRLSISDTGMGMTKDIMQHIFEPFFTTKPVDKGTGLGMANVHGTITAHQGAMIIESELMEGTTFDLFFPRADYINDPAFIGAAQDVNMPVDHTGVRLLLVDDQSDVLMMLNTMLTRAGFECVAKLNSMEALEYLKEAHDAFDLVITDQNMPKMTGLELIEQVAQFNDKLPFIILSGYSHERLREIKSCFPSIKETVRKPARKEALLQIIDRVLKDLQV